MFLLFNLTDRCEIPVASNLIALKSDNNEKRNNTTDTLHWLTTHLHGYHSIKSRRHGDPSRLVVSWLVRLTLALAIIGEDTLLSVPLSTQVYKWVPANLMLGVTLR